MSVGGEDGALPFDVGYQRRVLFVEDEPFMRGLIAESLTSAGFEVHACVNASSALAELPHVDPHVVISDLDLGPGPSGVDLLRQVAAEHPWLGLVALTAHSSVELAVSNPLSLPVGTVYVVKSELGSSAELVDLVESAVGNRSVPEPTRRIEQVEVSSAQAEILRLIAMGYSNAGIAAQRGISQRAAESLAQRTFTALGLHADPHLNLRVLACRMWQQGEVSVR